MMSLSYKSPDVPSVVSKSSSVTSVTFKISLAFCRVCQLLGNLSTEIRKRYCHLCLFFASLQTWSVSTTQWSSLSRLPLPPSTSQFPRLLLVLLTV
jgi:hypothetical protein